MPRRNHKSHSTHRPDPTERYNVEYIFMDECPEISMVIAHRLKVIYKNLSAASWADTVHEVRGEADKYLMMARRGLND